jgi:predicted small secreted protein
MFMVFFALLVGSITLRESWQLTMITGSLLGILYLAYIYFFQTKEKKKIFITAIRIILILGAIMGSWVRYNRSLQSPPPKRNFIGTGIVDDTYKQGKYIFTTSQGSFILTTKNTYTIKDTLLVVGTFSSGIFSSSEPKEFLDFDYPKRLKMKGLQGLIYERSSQKIQNIPAKDKSI